MRCWFQNLNCDGKNLFHFRGSVSREGRGGTWFEYSLCSGPALRFKYQHGEAGDSDSSSVISLGLLFFSAWLTFPLPRSWYFQKKCKATWDSNREFYLVEGREYGFYFYQWAFVWSFHNKINESSSQDPWWMRQYIRLDDLIFGKTEFTERELLTAENIVFKLGGKEFVMNHIRWDERKYFRRFIPFSLYHRIHLGVQMKIEKPPMRSGKGENSWDCDDDGCFGLSAPWDYERPTYLMRKNCERLAVEKYVNNVLKDAGKYGGSSSERGITSDSRYEFIGTLNRGVAAKENGNGIL